MRLALYALIVLGYLAVAEGSEFKAAPLLPQFDDGRPQVHPQVASNGEGVFLLVWQQGIPRHGQQSSDIFAIRLDKDGKPMDSTALALCRCSGDQTRPQVVFSRGAFVVVWQDFRSGKDWDIYGVRIGADDPAPRLQAMILAEGSRNQAGPVLADNGEQLLLFWQEFTEYGFYKLSASVIENVSSSRWSSRPVPIKRVAKGDWYGYTLGNSIGTRDIHPNAHPSNLYGGNIVATSYDGGWLLGWIDESNWVAGGPRSHTRRFAILHNKSGTLEATEVARAPSRPVGDGAGRLVTGHTMTVYANHGILGRGNRMAYAYLISPELKFREHPNYQPKTRGSGWRGNAAISLFYPRIPIGGPIATTHLSNRYLFVAPGAAVAGEDQAARLYLSVMDEKGKLLDSRGPMLIYEGKRPAAPAMAADGDRALLVFSDDHNGKRILWTKIIEPL